MSGFEINQVTISGNLTADPELRSTQGGMPVCNIRIASNKRIKNGDEWTDRPGYYDVTVWGGLGESLSKQVTKGDKIAVAGTLDWREYEDNDGNKRQRVFITADSILPASAKNNGSNGSSSAPTADDDIPF